MTQQAGGDRVLIGRVIKVFGIRGEVSVEATGDDPDRFAPKSKVYLLPGEYGEERPEAGRKLPEPKCYTVASRRMHLGRYLLRFVETPDRNAAELLVGHDLFVDATALPALPEGTYYHFQLIGLAVHTADGKLLGTVDRVVQSGASDLYRVLGAGGEWLIPALKEFVRKVDLGARTITLQPREDLLEAQKQGPEDEAEHDGEPRRKGPPPKGLAAKRPGSNRRDPNRPGPGRPGSNRSGLNRPGSSRPGSEAHRKKGPPSSASAS